MTHPTTFLIVAFVLMVVFLVIAEGGLWLRDRREQQRRDEWRRRKKS
jgi:hypothetical protein